jgi:hypothetical protein
MARVEQAPEGLSGSWCPGSSSVNAFSHERCQESARFQVFCSETGVLAPHNPDKVKEIVMILNTRAVTALIALSFASAAPVAAMQPVPSFNDHPEHYSAAKAEGVQGRAAVTLTGRSALPVPSFNDHPEHTLQKSNLGVEGRTGASVSMNTAGWPALPKAAY